MYKFRHTVCSVDERTSSLAAPLTAVACACYMKLGLIVSGYQKHVQDLTDERDQIRVVYPCNGTCMHTTELLLCHGEWDKCHGEGGEGGGLVVVCTASHCLKFSVVCPL